MRVTLIRHGEAGDDAPRDEERALTERGRQQARRVGRALARRGVRFSALVASPLVRALQTAEIIAAAVGHRGRVTISGAIAPEAPPEKARALLASLAAGGVGSVALVAHEPILSSLAALLLGVPRFRGLRKGEALRIRLPGGPAQPGALRWRVDPETGRRERL